MTPVKRIWSRLKVSPVVAASLAIATAVTVWSVAEISLVPPRLTPRALELGTATTHVVVDTPRSSILDLRADTYSLVSLTQRAVILGNVMANGRVRQDIATRAGVPIDALEVTPPLTPAQPRAQVGSRNQKRATDILKSTDQYRLSIQANPTVPMLGIYSQAPTAETAERLANASVDSLRAYLIDLAASEQTPTSERIRLLQLGSARGEVINSGIEWQVSIVAFILTFSIACATLTFIARVRRRWRIAALAERTASG